MNEQDHIDLQARTSLQQQLLVELYAIVFRGRPDALEELMTRLEFELGTGATRTLEPMAADHHQELIISTLLHLKRFRAKAAAQI